jgi:hypothetical protein
MWGNRLGWSIAAGIVVVTVGFLLWVSISAQDVSPRTDFTRDPKTTELIILPVAPKTVLPSMTSGEDAGAIYRRAIAAFAAEPTVYTDFARGGRERDLEFIPAIYILAQATGCESGDIFASDPGRIVTLANEKPDLEALVSLAACARRAGMLLAPRKPADAMQLYEAVFSLGAKLYRERLTYEELDAGLTMMAEGSALIAQLNPHRTAACARFDEARRAYVTQRILPVRAVLHTLDQPTLERHAGDVIYLARHAEDRMWQVEAIFALARYRFNAGRSADQHVARKVLNELSNSSDPVVRAAAVAARDLTEPQYRMLR